MNIIKNSRLSFLVLSMALLYSLSPKLSYAADIPSEPGCFVESYGAKMPGYSPKVGSPEAPVAGFKAIIRLFDDGALSERPANAQDLLGNSWILFQDLDGNINISVRAYAWPYQIYKKLGPNHYSGTTFGPKYIDIFVKEDKDITRIEFVNVENRSEKTVFVCR